MKIFLITLIVILIVVIAYYKITYPSFTYKYRMTVEVETPQGMRSGSSVIEVNTTQWPEWLSGVFGGNISNSILLGEAVFVDLDDEKNLVALLATGSEANSGNSMFYIAPQAFQNLNNVETGSSEKLEWARRLSDPKMIGKKVEVKREQIPTMVSFKDINDPKSIELIYATDSYEILNKQGWREFPRKVTTDNFSAKFGEGYQLESVWLELTDDPVTTKLGKYLPWLKNPDLGAIHINTPAGDIRLYKEYHFISNKYSF